MRSIQINGIPKSEDIWLTQRSVNGGTYYITAKRDRRDMYFIYKMVDGKAVKLGKHQNPTELTARYVE